MSYRQKVFLKGFGNDEFAKFRTTYETINPDRPIETANVKYEETDQRFRIFIEVTDNSTQSFVEEILPHHNLFLNGKIPLSGNRVTTSVWDYRGKFGVYEAAEVLPKIAGSRVLDIVCNGATTHFS
jgi:hypothetical protein